MRGHGGGATARVVVAERMRMRESREVAGVQIVIQLTPRALMAFDTCFSGLNWSSRTLMTSPDLSTT